MTIAAKGVLSGHQDLVIGGGVEMMSRWPTGFGAGDEFSAGNPRLQSLHPMVPQGISADLIATIEGFSRKDCDAFAVQNQQRAAVAHAEGRFDKSLVPIYRSDGTLALDHDEHPRPGSTLESLAALQASFEELGSRRPASFDVSLDEVCRRVYPEIDRVHHVHHAGNSSGVVDGASAILVASSDYAKARGLAARARIRMSAVAGSEPVIMLTAPAAASQTCLKKAGMTVRDIDLWEINEAFAAVPLKTIRDLDLAPERVNVNGGAIALGHPIGGTGPMLIETALDELERRDRTTALITMCTGGGMATATIIERR